MTGYTVHTGASKKFVSGWDRIFESSEPAQKKPAKKKTAAKGKAKAKSKKKSS